MLILASTSKYRRAQLEQLGLSFSAEAPGVDEDAVKAEGLGCAALAERLAAMKAEAVFSRHPEAVVLGGDQVLDFDGEALGKPGSVEGAVAQLMAMQGRTHRLLTAVCLRHPEGRLAHLDVTNITFRPLDEAAIRRYVALDDPIDCAGSCKIEQGGIALIERIETEDPSAVTGLPLIAVVRMLAGLGISVP